MTSITTNATQLQIRIDRNLKREAEEVLKEMGITTSQAIKLFLRQIILKKEIPFKIQSHSDLYVQEGPPMSSSLFIDRIRQAEKEYEEGRSIPDHLLKIDLK